MKQKSRRSFLQRSLAAASALYFGQWSLGNASCRTTSFHESKPWLELSQAAYLHNVAQISQMAGGKPVIAVLKNNAYGLGALEVSQMLNACGQIYGMAVVKDETALAMREKGVDKPILLMGDFDTALSKELAKEEVILSIHSHDSFRKINELASLCKRPIKVALYIDTGLGRMGIPFEKTLEIANQVKKQPLLKITQTFSTLTTPKEFAIEQINRFQCLSQQFRKIGVETGTKHLAPSYSMLDLPNSHEDAVRPGILLHGSFPMAHMQAAEQYPLQVTHKLKAPIIRLEKLKAGDTIGFSRFYQLKQDEWIATLPVGWADGYYSGAENGAKVLLGNQLYPVVNVNASHTNIGLGDETSIRVGDVATLIGPNRPEITPEGFASLTGGHNYLQINYKESLTKHVYEAF